MSWNVNTYINKGNLLYRLQIITEEIIKISPDILFIQEAGNELLDMLRKKYRLYDSVLTHGGLCCILTKPHLGSYESIKFDTTGVGIISQDSILVNCHLVPCRNNSEYRKYQLNEIVKNNKDKKITFIGDMNMKDDETYTSLKDVAVEVNDNTPTWNLSYFKQGSTIRKRFDRIYTNQPFSNYKVYSNLSGISDHLPLSIMINFS